MILIVNMFHQRLLPTMHQFSESEWWGISSYERFYPFLHFEEAGRNFKNVNPHKTNALFVLKIKLLLTVLPHFVREMTVEDLIFLWVVLNSYKVLWYLHIKNNKFDWPGLWCGFNTSDKWWNWKEVMGKPIDNLDDHDCHGKEFQLTM